MDIEAGSVDAVNASSRVDYDEHVGTIPCCICGDPIEPNPANMCAHCVQWRCHDIIGNVTTNATITFCKECGRYHRPPSQWVAMDLESPELLALCLKRLKGLEKLKLIDAGWVWTEPHSRRLKVKVMVQGSAKQVNSIIVQQTFVAEIVVVTQQCEDCQRSYTEHTWKACVQVRQKVAHKRTFLLLEQYILKHGMNRIISNVQEAPGGLDLFFPNRSRALQMLDFVQSVVPTQTKQSRRLVSQDFKNNSVNYKYTYYIEIVPVCKFDLVCFPKKLAQSCGGISPLLLCLQVHSSLKFIDPQTLQTTEMTGSKYWRSPFRSLLNSKHFVEYTILDVVKTGQTSGKHALADITCARTSDLGMNDLTFETVSYLGNILKPGDTAAGYDLSSAVLNDDDIAAVKGMDLPEVVLVKKTYQRKNRARRRKFKLRSLEKQEIEKTRKADQERDEADQELFLRDLEEDMDLRCRVNLYARDANEVPATDAGHEDEDEDEDEDPEFPDLRLDELIGGLGLEPEASSVRLPHDESSDANAEVGQKRRNDRHELE